MLSASVLPRGWVAALMVSFAGVGLAQQGGSSQPMTSNGAAVQGVAGEAAMHGMTEPATLIGAELRHSSSGTSIEPESEPMAMWMGERGGWRLMLHGIAFVSDTQQHAAGDPTAPPAAVCEAARIACVASYERGGDKLFSTNWVMPMAQRRLGPGQLTVRTMLSLEPATISGREFPELFQQGETAFGRPIIDGQHPHDFVMELAALYDLRTSEHTLLSFYAAPVGDPAIGPTAYPHRLSASEDPLAALGHHQEDSTHIAFNVITAGFTYKWARVEGSGFHGAEPDEARWHFQPSPNGLAVDSYSGRVTVAPARDVSAQYSVAHITAPEELFPHENQRRQTASVMYNRRLGSGEDGGNWANTALWGQTKSLSDGTLVDSYLLESLVKFRRRNFAWTRVEVAGRTSELLDTPPALALGAPEPPEVSVGHVQEYSAGYDREYGVGRHVAAAVGGQFTVYRAPDALASTYGRVPFGGVGFVRFRIRQ